MNSAMDLRGDIVFCDANQRPYQAMLSPPAGCMLSYN